MGTKRSQSSQRALSRVRLPREDRETLLPCPVCDGSGKKVHEDTTGTYKMSRCKWCEGTGAIDHTMYSLFRRWLRLYNHGRLSGQCPLHKT